MSHLNKASQWWMLAIIALGLVSFLYLYELVLDPHLVMVPASGLGTDLLTQRWPDAATFAQAIRESHQFPFWDPSIMVGYPTVGNPAIIQYYPFWWLFLILP